MDKKDFYRDLMEAYTVDKEKIKHNAKRQAMQNRYKKVQKLIMGISACAAAAAVAVLSVNIMPFFKHGANIVDTTLDAAVQRVNEAEKIYRENADKKSDMDMFISFEQKLNSKEVLLVFSSIEDYSKIKLSLLYTEDGKCYKYTDDISEEVMFRGAKITAPSDFYKQISGLNAVSLVELVQGSKYTDKTFVPYIKPANIPVPVITDNTFITTVQIELPQTTEQPPVSNTSTYETTPAPSDTSDITSADPEATTSAATSQTGSHSGSQTQPIEIPLPNVTEAEFISNNKLVVITSDSLRLYKVENNSLSLETTFYVDNAKIIRRNSDSTALYITAKDSSGVSRLFYAEGKSGTLTELDISSITDSSRELSSIFSSQNGEDTVIKTVSPDSSDIYYASRTENLLNIVHVKRYDNPATVLSYADGYICTAVTMGSSVNVFKVSITDGRETLIGAFSEISAVTRSVDIKSAAITATNANGAKEHYVLSPSGQLIPIESPAEFSVIDFSVFKSGDKYYRIEGGSAVEITEGSVFFDPPQYCYSYTVDISQNGIATLVPVI